MDNENFELPILNEYNTVTMLIFLLVNGEAKATQLLKLGGSYYKNQQLASRLATLDLIEIEVHSKPKLNYIYRLTDKGRKVAQKLKEAEEIIGGKEDEAIWHPRPGVLASPPDVKASPKDRRKRGTDDERDPSEGEDGKDEL